jgi:hypothetical protein
MHPPEAKLHPPPEISLRNQVTHLKVTADAQSGEGRLRNRAAARK